MSIFGFFATLNRPPTVERFWKWFQRHEATLFDSDGSQSIFAELGAELQKINPSLTFDVGPKESGTRQFILSAGGIRQAFPIVEALLVAAPQLPQWKVLKFRRRREPADVHYGGLSISASSVSVLLKPEGSKLGLTVFLPGYNKAAHNTYLSMAFLFLDQALGEYDVETRVGSIEVHSPGSYTAVRTYDLEQLPAAFDSYFAKT